MKKETIEEAAENFWRNDDSMSDYVQQAYVTGFMAGSKWQKERKTMLTEREREKLIKNSASIFVAAGGILTLAFAIYFIVDLIKKWYS